MRNTLEKIPQAKLDLPRMKAEKGPIHATVFCYSYVMVQSTLAKNVVSVYGAFQLD